LLFVVWEEVVAHFSELRVYQLAEEIANRLWVIVAKWDCFAKDTIGKQIVRSADSIGANIAEGNGEHVTFVFQ
jgi:four helix bundle protein